MIDTEKIELRIIDGSKLEEGSVATVHVESVPAQFFQRNVDGSWSLVFTALDCEEPEHELGKIGELLSELNAQVVFLLNKFNLWSEEGTFTFPDGFTYTKDEVTPSVFGKIESERGL